MSPAATVDLSIFFLSILSLVAVCILKLVITNVYIWEGYFFDEFIPLLL